MKKHSYAWCVDRLQQLADGMWFGSARDRAIHVSFRAVCDCGLDPNKWLNLIPSAGLMGEMELSDVLSARRRLARWEASQVHVDVRRMSSPTNQQLARAAAIRSCMWSLVQDPSVALVQATIQASWSAVWYSLDWKDKIGEFKGLEPVFSLGVFLQAIRMAEMRQADIPRRPMARCQPGGGL